MSERFSPEQLEQVRKALEHYVAYFGPEHDHGCPGDSTCECDYKPMNDGANDACRAMKQAAADARTLAALREWLESHTGQVFRDSGVAYTPFRQVLAELDRLMARPDGAEETQG